MNAMDVVPSESFYTFLPIAAVVAMVFGAMFLIALGFFIGRGATVNMRAAGVTALTLASILFLSGLWCIFLSPTTTYSDVKESFYRPVVVDSMKSWSYSFSVQEGETLAGSVNERIVYAGPTNASATSFNIRILDPSGDFVWSENNVTKSYFNVKASKAGAIRIEIQNPNKQPIEHYIQATVGSKVVSRPLEPLGQWLSLVSFPILGLGIWASGLFSAMRVRSRAPASRTSSAHQEILS